MEMKQLKLFFAIVAIALVTVSCSNDDEPAPVAPVPEYTSMKAADGRTILVSTAVSEYAEEKDFAAMLGAVQLPVPTRSSMRDGASSVPMDSVRGYAEQPYLLNDVWQQVRLGNWCSRYGLVAGETYLLNIKRVTQYIPCAYNELLREYDYHLPSDLNMGYYDGRRGYLLEDENEGGKLYAYTLLAAIDYDAAGNVVDTHYPCEPEDLMWKWYVIRTN